MPTREDFIKVLSKGTGGEDVVLADMKEYLTPFVDILQTIDTFYAENKLDSWMQFFFSLVDAFLQKCWVDAFVNVVLLSGFIFSFFFLFFRAFIFL